MEYQAGARLVSTVLRSLWPPPSRYYYDITYNKEVSGLYRSFCWQDVLAKRIIGEEVQPSVISDQLYSFSRDFGQRGTYVEAISGKTRIQSCLVFSR